MTQATFTAFVRHWHLLAGLCLLLLGLISPGSAAFAAEEGYCLGEGCVNADPLGVLKQDSLADSDRGLGRGTVDPGDAWPFGEIIFWSSLGDPGAPLELPGCNCYFSSDCVSGSSCNYGILSEEDNCAYMENKPNMTPGAGCDIVYLGDFQLGICDGLCTTSTEGSSFGVEDASILQQGVRLWGDAFLHPALNGGGFPDEGMMTEALSLPYNHLEHASLIGRYTSSALASAAGLEYQHYYCHYDMDDPNLSDYFVDLSTDTCLAAAAQLSLDTLLAEMNQPGSGRQMLEELRLLCPDQSRIFPLTCANSFDRVTCGYQRIQDMAAFLTTPPNRQPRNTRDATWLVEP